MPSTEFAVLRVRKLKEQNLIRKTDAHNRRLSTVHHADNSGAKYKRVIGEERHLAKAIADRIAVTNCKTRSDSVLALEVLMSASPQYFRPDNPGAAGEYDRDRMTVWARASLKYAKEKWGENIICADLHLDESTPHIHLVVTPIATKQRKRRGKEEYYESCVLDANSMFGRKSLIQMQTEYAGALGPLGIRRGIRGSPAKHQQVKNFYRVVNESNNLSDNFELPAPPLTNRGEWQKNQQVRM